MVAGGLLVRWSPDRTAGIRPVGPGQGALFGLEPFLVCQRRPVARRLRPPLASRCFQSLGRFRNPRACQKGSWLTFPRLSSVGGDVRAWLAMSAFPCWLRRRSTGPYGLIRTSSVAAALVDVPGRRAVAMPLPNRASSMARFMT